MPNTVKVASVYPEPLVMCKARTIPQKIWRLEGCKKGNAPSTCDFNDVYENVFVGNDVGNGLFSSNKPMHELRTVKAEDLAVDFVTQQYHPPRTGSRGVWIVDSLGEGQTFKVVSCTNGHPAVLQFDRPHTIASTTEIAITGGMGTWGALNNSWTATRITETQVSIPVDTTPFGTFSGADLTATFRIHLSLEEEAKIMRSRQDPWMDYWVKDARKLYLMKPELIIPLHHVAADWFGITGEPWQSKYTTTTIKSCPWCMEQIPNGAVMCKACGKIADPEGYARMEFETKRKSEEANTRIAKMREIIESGDREITEELQPAG